MSWFTALFVPQPRHETPLTIELAPTDPTSPEPELITVSEPVATVIEAAHPRRSSGDALDAETLERHLLAKSQHRLQGLAVRVAAARSRLLNLTAADEALSAPEDERHFQGPDPEAWLQGELSGVLAQIEQAEAGRKRADARRVMRSYRVTPLATGVSRLHTALLRERAYLLRECTGISNSPIQKLREAGLNEEQIASLGQLDPVAKTLAKYGARLAEVEPVIAALDRWHASGNREHHHLDGLGFDALIAAAQPVDEEVAR